MNEIILSIMRSMVSFILLILVTAVIGKHINAHKNYYSFAFAITIGSFVANMGFNTHFKFSEMLLSFLALVVLYYAFLSISAKSRKIRSIFSGRPTVLIEKGNLLDQNMKKIKFSLDDLNQHLRELGLFNIEEVDYAILEVSGELAIRKKSPYQNPTNQDINLPFSSFSLPVELIMNGKLVHKNVQPPYTKEWIEGECRKRDLVVGDIYYAVVNSNGSLFVDPFKDDLHSPSDIE
ncbi:DUF421 domain-containing protein [Halobacillus salinarum]|uniref:DUF421 domain-containing protein n=1 Tax=Halobacillus salinarum TaxID=2932257 RepID=A0ABY4ENG6_9BACI|nr:DUF421 domain-containing protein [Halobacillus salinarum]UOQ45530.1 DUF421 domain-containing protein [Halobacillus salinarum]